MKTKTVYTWEESDIKAGMRVWPEKLGHPLYVGYFVDGYTTEYVLIDIRDGMIMRASDWATKDAMAQHFTKMNYSPVDPQSQLCGAAK